MNIDESNIIDIVPNTIEEVKEWGIKNNALGGFVKPDINGKI